MSKLPTLNDIEIELTNKGKGHYTEDELFKIEDAVIDVVIFKEKVAQLLRQHLKHYEDLKNEYCEVWGSKEYVDDIIDKDKKNNAKIEALRLVLGGTK